QAAVPATVLTEDTPVRVDIRANPAERGERLVAKRFAHHLATAGVIEVQRLQREHLLGGEVVGERSLGNACGAHDVPHTGPVVTLPVHDLHALAQDHISMGLLSHSPIWTGVLHVSNKVGMERTTLTRNLRPLTRAKWVTAGTGKDRRQHLLQLTAAGRRKLVRSLLLWEVAQRQFLSQFGTESLQELRALLISAESAVTNAFTADQEKPQPARLRTRKGPTYAG